MVPDVTSKFYQMSDVKTIVVPDNNDGNGMNNAFWPMMAMMGGGGGFGGGMWNNPLMYLVWMTYAQRMWGNDWQNNPDANAQYAALQNQLQDNQNSNLLMDAIRGVGNSVHELSGTWCSNFGVLQQSLCDIRGGIDKVAGQMGFTGERVINSVQAGNASVIQALQNCCCEQRLATCQQTNALQNAINGVAVGQERGFSSLAFETKSQTCDIEKAIAASTSQILAGQAAAEKREMQDKIDHLREENGIYRSSAMTTQIVGQAVAPIAAAVNALQGDVNGIKCKLPETVPVSYQPFTAVPNCVAYQYGLAPGFGFGNGGFFG